MQKINIKKVTKEQMLKMLEEAQTMQEAAETEANVLRAKLTETEKTLDAVSAQYKSADHATENLRGEIGALTEKLEENEKALEEVTAKYKSADHSAAMLRSRIDEAEKMRDQALEAHGEDMKALEKAKDESRELAKQLGEREIELAKVKQECESELAKQRAEAEKALMKMNAIINGLLKRFEAQRDISEELPQEPQVVHGASVAQRVALHERVFPLLTDKERERRGESNVPIQKERAGEL